eukprot:360056_1
MASIQYLFILITSIFCIFIAFPLTVYHGCKYYRNRNYVEFKKRYANITLYEITFTAIKFLLDAIAMFMIWLQHGNLSSHTTYGYTPDIIISIANIFYYCTIFCQTLRFFLLSFSVNLSKVLSHNNEWKSIINSKDTTQTDKIKWYLKRKPKYSSITWLSKLFLPFFIVFCSFEVFNELIGDELKASENIMTICDIINSSLDVIIYVPMFCLYFTIPKFNDNFFISGELKLIFVAFVIWTMFYILEALLGNTSLFSDERINEILVSVSFFIIFVCDLIIILISTYYINKKMLVLIKQNALKKHF